MWIYGLSLKLTLSSDVFLFHFSFFVFVFIDSFSCTRRSVELWEMIISFSTLDSLFFQICLFTCSCSPGLAQRNSYGCMNGWADLCRVMGRAEHSCSPQIIFSSWFGSFPKEVVDNMFSRLGVDRIIVEKSSTKWVPDEVVDKSKTNLVSLRSEK